MDMEQLMDLELVQRAKEGSGDAFDVLVKRYQSKITQLVYRYVHNQDTALDLVQDIFFKIFKNLTRFKGECAFSTWIYRIAVNDCIDHTRRKKVRQETSLDQLSEVGFDVQDERREADVWDSVNSNMDREMVHKALANIPSDQQTVLILKIFEELTFDQIAGVLGEPVSTIKSRLYKALDMMGRQFRQRQFLERFKQ